MKAKAIKAFGINQEYDNARGIAFVVDAVRKHGSAEIIDDGFSLLSWVALRGDLDSVRFLLDNGADPNFSPDSGGVPPIMSGAKGTSSAEALRLLLAAGGNPNYRTDPRNESPAYCAARSSRPDLLEILLEAGADPTIRTEYGPCALDVKVKPEASDELVAVFRKYGHEPTLTAFKDDPATARIKQLLAKRKESS